jgi:hypothetical protein
MQQRNERRQRRHRIGVERAFRYCNMGPGGAWRVSKVLCAGIFPDSPARWEVMLWIKTHRSGEPRQALCAPGRRTRHLQTAALTRDR